jgi:putative phosphonate metabolism protein
LPENVSERWAVYYAPPAGHPLWQAGCRWLGRNPETGAVFDGPDWLPVRQWQALVATPARYGFHATLKPPMRLRPGCYGADLRRQATALAADWACFLLPPLEVQCLGDFLAVRSVSDSPMLDRLAADCVRGLDELRAPPTEAEHTRRRPERLSPRQGALLDRWGYAYVLDEFRFHLTLTGSLAGQSIADIEALRDRLAAQLAPALREPVAVDALALFRQRGDGPFELVERLPFTGS